jgi:hypothetical protein
MSTSWKTVVSFAKKTTMRMKSRSTLASFAHLGKMENSSAMNRISKEKAFNKSQVTSCVKLERLKNLSHMMKLKTWPTNKKSFKKAHQS